jgi:DNA-binding FadR family transcriptional regulator
MFWRVFRLLYSVRKEQHWVGPRTWVFTKGVGEEMVRQHEATVSAIATRNPQAAEEPTRVHIATAGAPVSQPIVDEQ